MRNITITGSVVGVQDELLTDSYGGSKEEDRQVQMM